MNCSDVVNCNDFENRLNDVLDARQLPQRDEQLVRHAQACEDCQQLLAAQEALFAGLEMFEPATGSARFTARVMHEVNAPQLAVASAPLAVASARAKHSSWNWPAIAVLLTGAAAVLIALTIGFRISDWGNQPDSGTIASTVPAGSEGLSPERYLEYRQLFHLWALQFPDAVVQLETVEQYAPGIRPVRVSFVVAIDTLYRTIPGSREPRSNGVPQAILTGTLDVLA